jgi:copper(I)-binding protein
MNMLMKDLVLAVSIMTVGMASVGARQVPAPPTPSAPPASAAASTNVIGPKIQFATPMYDFGRMKAGDPVKYTYIFTNTGDRLLVLNSVQPQCGCTTAGDWTKQVEPGQTGSIPIQFNTANYNGPVFKQVTVSCNVTSQPTLFVQLKGTVFKAFDFNPPMAVLTIPPDAESASCVVTITNNMDEPLLLSAPESNNRAFAAELKTNALGKGYQLIVSAVPPMPAGSVQGQINLRTSWTNPAVITVPVAANVQPAVMVIPSYITLNAGPLDKATTNSVAIQNKSTNALQLSKATVNVTGVSAEIRELRPGKDFTALVAFPQGFQVPLGQQVELSVKSSNPKYPLLKVPVMQVQRPAAPPAPTPPHVPTVPVVKPAVSPTGGLVPPPLPPPLPPGSH